MKFMRSPDQNSNTDQHLHPIMQYFKSLLIPFVKDDRFSELLLGSFIAFALRIIGLIFGYVFIILITRNYGADTLGVFALASTILTMVSIIGKAGFDIALVRFISQHFTNNRLDLVKEVYYKALIIIIPLSIMISIALFMIAPLLSNEVFHKEYLVKYIRFVSIAVLPFVLINVNSQAFRGIKKVTAFAFFQYVSGFFFSALLLFILNLIFNGKENLPILSFVIAIFTGAIFSQLYWHKNAEFSHTQTGNSLNVMSLLNVSIPMMLTDAMFVIMTWMTTIMMGIFRTDTEVGIFNVTLRISAVTSITLIAINSIAAPIYAELYGKGDLKGLNKIAKQTTKLVFWSTTPILILIFLFPKYILSFFGPEFNSGWLSLLILTIGQFVNSISGPVGFILQMTGREKAFQNIVLVACLISVLLGLVIIPSYGIIGAAIANTVSLIFWNILTMFYIKKVFGFMPIITR